MKRTTQRVGAAALASAVLFLTGCSVPAPTPSEESPQPAAKVTSSPPSPSPSPTRVSTMPTDVPFDFDASIFPDSWDLQWVDNFASAPQFTPIPLETTMEGMRLYQDELTACTILMYGGQYYPPPGVSGDRVLSDTELKILTGVGDDLISQYATDHTIPQPGENGSIAARSVLGRAGDGSTSFTTARVIESQGQSAFVDINCPGEGAPNLYDVLISGGLLTLTMAPPPS